MNPKLWSDVCDLADKLKEEEDEVLVVSHHDADGITACAILVDLLLSMEKKVEFKILKQLDGETIKKIENTKKKVIFSDMGSGQLSLLHKSKLEGFYIVDHHPPEDRYERQINPHFYGYDGGKDVSGAGMAYFLAKALKRMNMAHMAIVGAVGDMQDSNGKLHSLNRIILDDAQQQGLIRVDNDLRMFGRQSRALPRMLTYSSYPYLPGLTGNNNACIAFLENMGIELRRGDGSWRSYADLDLEEKRKLTTALYVTLLDFNVPEFIIQGMIGEVYTLLNEKKRTELRDAKEYATVLNACGRQEQPEIGVGVCLGGRGRDLDKAKDLLTEHRRKLKEGLNFLNSSGVEETENLYYFNAGGMIDENIIGVIAGMSYGARIPTTKGGVMGRGKPILAFAKDKDNPDMLKVSARANWDLVRRGLHLGNALREISGELGGEGGGHDIAAGARIPQNTRSEFLGKINEIFNKQLKGI